MYTSAAAARMGDGASTSKVDESSANTTEKSWRVRKLSGGYQIPYPSKPKKTECCEPNLKSSTPEKTQLQLRVKPGFIPNIPAVECAICYSPVKEATVPKCGHMFCHQCITNWSKIRSWCPLCQGPVDPLIRIYSVDQQIEFYLGNFSKEEREELEEARERREAEQKARFKSEKRFWNRTLRDLNHLHLYFMSKGFFHGIGIQLQLAWMSFKRLSFGSMSLAIGILIGLILGYFIFCYWGFGPGHFLKYMFNYRSDWTPEPNYAPNTSECDVDDLSCNTQSSHVTPVQILAPDVNTPAEDQRKSSSTAHHKYNLFAMLSPYFDILWNAWIAT